MKEMEESTERHQTLGQRQQEANQAILHEGMSRVHQRPSALQPLDG